VVDVKSGMKVLKYSKGVSRVQVVSLFGEFLIELSSIRWTKFLARLGSDLAAAMDAGSGSF